MSLQFIIGAWYLKGVPYAGYYKEQNPSSVQRFDRAGGRESGRPLFCYRTGTVYHADTERYCNAASLSRRYEY